MAEFFNLPGVTPTMEEGTLAAWRLQEGEKFESGSVIAEVGTDKATGEAELFDEGVLIKHLVAEGDEIPVGFPIAIIGQSVDEDISGLLKEFEAIKAKAESGGDDAPAAAPAAVEAAPTPAPKALPPVKVATKDREWMGKKLPADVQDPPGDIGAANVETRVAASPLARKIAADKGISLGAVTGSGPKGRILKEDVESFKPMSGGFAAPADEVVRNSPMRKTIARRLLESHQDIPTFFLTVDLDMQGFVDFRKTLKANLPDVKVSYNDMLIAAVARALRDVPEANASWGDKAITRHGRVDIGVAVALPDGLITPVLRNADQLKLSEISSEVRELAGRAKAGQLGPDEYTGGTFTISNLGMFGIEHFTAIINPPEAAILAVGGINQVPVVVDGQLTVGWRMKVTMTCDHRVLDGAVGSAYLLALRKYVENPYLMMV